MSTEEFWEEEPRLMNAYRISFENKQKQLDEQAWLNGYYVYVAVQTNLYNAFRKSSEPTRTYLEKPFTFSETQDKDDIQKEKIRAREEKIRNRLNKSKKVLEKKEQDKGR